MLLNVIEAKGEDLESILRFDITQTFIFRITFVKIQQRITTINFAPSASVTIEHRSNTTRTAVLKNGVRNCKQSFFTTQSISKIVLIVRIQICDRIPHLVYSLYHFIILFHIEVHTAKQTKSSIFINMTYARSGTLVLGGLNNQNGLLQVQDADGNVIGEWNNGGISAYKGVIRGPSVTVGGQNDQDGVITVLDANGNTIGTWSNAGIMLSAGSISSSDGLNQWILNGNSAAFIAQKGVIGDFTLENGQLSYTDTGTTGNPTTIIDGDGLKTEITYSYGTYAVVVSQGYIDFIKGSETIMRMKVTPGTSSDFVFQTGFGGNFTTVASYGLLGWSFAGGATGTFNTTDGKSVTVSGGIVTAITAGGAQRALTISDSI